MLPELFIHLPLLRLSTGCDFPLGDGERLVRLPFEQWRLLDAVAPTFFVCALPQSQSSGTLWAEGERIIADEIERVSAVALIVWPEALLPKMLFL